MLLNRFKSFNIEDPLEIKEINERIVSGLREKENEHELQRAKDKKSVIGAKELSRTPIGKSYTPNRTGKKMICLGSRKEDRKAFIANARELFQKGREVLAKWRDGDYSVPYPVGLYPPSMPKRGDLLPGALLACC